jgi:hypothetical protein
MGKEITYFIILETDSLNSTTQGEDPIVSGRANEEGGSRFDQEAREQFKGQVQDFITIFSQQLTRLPYTHTKYHNLFQRQFSIDPRTSH